MPGFETAILLIQVRSVNYLLAGSVRTGVGVYIQIIYNFVACDIVIGLVTKEVEPKKVHGFAGGNCKLQFTL